MTYKVYNLKNISNLASFRVDALRVRGKIEADFFHSLIRADYKSALRRESRFLFYIHFLIFIHSCYG